MSQNLSLFGISQVPLVKAAGINKNGVSQMRIGSNGEKNHRGNSRAVTMQFSNNIPDSNLSEKWIGNNDGLSQSKNRVERNGMSESRS